MAAGNDDPQIAVVVYLIGGDEDGTLAGRNLEDCCASALGTQSSMKAMIQPRSLPCGKT